MNLDFLPIFDPRKETRMNHLPIPAAEAWARGELSLCQIVSTELDHSVSLGADRQRRLRWGCTAITDHRGSISGNLIFLILIFNPINLEPKQLCLLFADKAGAGTTEVHVQRSHNLVLRSYLSLLSSTYCCYTIRHLRQQFLLITKMVPLLSLMLCPYILLANSSLRI
jgi:hypothetical protein